MNAPLEQLEPDADFAPGSTFARYRVVRCIGTGGMGAVFEGFHELLSRRVAIKVLHARAAEKADARERFLREARSVARIRHPHVVDVFDVGVLHDKPYLVMEYLEGETLESAIERVGRMDDRAATAVLLPIAAALAAVHRHGLVHRDVKPENIFLATDARGHVVPKLVDFGIAKDLSAPIAGSNHTVVGTPHFMSPEQARGSLGLDARTDQYSFGVLGYELLTGRMPFDADSLLELVRAIDAGNVVPPSSFVPTIDPRMEAIIVRAMSRDAEARFASMRDVGLALLEFASPRLVNALGADFHDDEIKALGEVVPSPSSAIRPVARQRDASGEVEVLRSAETTLDEVVRKRPIERVTTSGTVPILTPVAAADSVVSRSAIVRRRQPVLVAAAIFAVLIASLGVWAFAGRETSRGAQRSNPPSASQRPTGFARTQAPPPAAEPTFAVAPPTPSTVGTSVGADEPIAEPETTNAARPSSMRTPRSASAPTMDAPSTAPSRPAFDIRLER